MQPTPAQLLGLPVVDPGGAPLGVIEDVGLTTWDQPKFLLVRFHGQGARLVRVDFRAVAEVRAEEVMLQRRPPPTLA